MIRTSMVVFGHVLLLLHKLTQAQEELAREVKTFKFRYSYIETGNWY